MESVSDSGDHPKSRLWAAWEAMVVGDFRVCLMVPGWEYLLNVSFNPSVCE